MSEYKWIAQDSDGFIKGFPKNEPFLNEDGTDYVSRNADWNKIQKSTGIKIKPLLINLETHDYKIEDGILMKVERQRIFKGSELQYKDKSGKWNDCSYDEYRIKPKTVKFRNYLYKGQVCVANEGTPLSDNIEWFGDWQEVEISEQPDQKWPTELVARIAKIDLQAAEWLRDNWSDIPTKYDAEDQRHTNSLGDLMIWNKTPQGSMYWLDIDEKL